LISGFGGVGASSSHRRIGRLSGGELAVPFLRSKRALSLMTMLPEVCELAQQVAWKEDASPSTVAGQGVVRFSGEKRSAV
jgi:hypothetical protein